MEVAIDRMYLHAVEACLDSVVCCLGVQLNVFFNLEGDEDQATPEDGRIGSTSKDPKLEEEVRAAGVNGIRERFLQATCASLQTPGTFTCPAALGASGL